MRDGDKPFQTLLNFTITGNYLLKSAPEFSKFRTIISIFSFYATTTGTYSWNFGDIFLICVCRAITFKFKQVNEQIEEFLSKGLKKVYIKAIDDVNQKEEYTIQIDDDDHDQTVGKGTSGKKLEDEPANNKRKSIETFKSQVVQMSQKLRNEQIFKTIPSTDLPDCWSEFRDKILILCKLSQDWTSFIVPLVLACYGCNMYLIILRVR